MGDQQPLQAQMDTKDYGIGAQILRDLGVRRMKLISNTPNRRKGITVYGLEIIDTVPMNP
jgi:3,4-dihydroxy 2-butanone 4-phosphate synthase/GTP cyclohydrolase II